MVPAFLAALAIFAAAPAEPPAAPPSDSEVLRATRALVGSRRRSS